MKRKPIALLLAATMLLAFTLAACQSASPGSGGGSEGGASGKLEVWDIWTNPDETNTIAWQTVKQMYKDANPDVEVTYVSTENEAFKTKISTAMSAGEIPDVFFGWGPAQIQPFVEAGKVLALDEYLDDAYMSNLYGGTLTNFTFDNKVYGLSMYQWAAPLYCNQEMFDQVGAAIPTTYTELTDAIAKFTAAGIVPIAVGAKDGWPAMFFQNIMAIRTAGAENVQQMLEGKKSFNDPAIVKSAQYVLDLVAMGAFDPGSLALSEVDATAMFNQGQVPMYYLGDWLVGGFVNPETSAVAGKVVAVNFPATDDGQDSTQMMGGATDCFCVAADTEDKQLAADYVKFVTKAMSEQSFAVGGTSPTRNFDQEPYLENIDPLAKQIMDFSAKSTGAVLAWDTFLVGEDAEKHKSLCQQLFAAEITAQTFAEEMAKLQE
jgi:raffinose/stachyose/melibiose transport system substrate-binding protein